jgi:hypothetical protein
VDEEVHMAGGLNVANAVLQGAEEEEVAYKEDSDH